MNSSRATLLLILSLLLTACFASPNFEDGDQFSVSVHHNGGNTETGNVAISGGSGVYSATGVQVTLADNLVTFSTGVVASADYRVEITKTSGSPTIFSSVTIAGYNFEADEEAYELVAPSKIAFSFKAVECLASCEADIIVGFLEVPAINITSIVPKIIPVLGGSITINGAGFAFTTPVTVTFSKGSKHSECDIIEVTNTHIVCTAAAGVSKGYTITLRVGPVSGTIAATYAEPFITGTRTQYADWSAFVYINGGNFNPNNLHVELTQGSEKKRSLTHPVCQIISASTTQITCSVTGLVTGPLSAVVSVQGYSTANGVPKNVGTVVVGSAYQPTSSATCTPPSGTPDIYQTEMCNCWSGYAPSDSTGTDCNVKAKCAQKLLGDTDYFGSDIPQQPSTSFKDDTLVITQTVGIVQNRRSSFINFRVPKLNHTLPALAAGTEGALTCNYPGILWEKTLNTLDCNEVFTARMPWSQNQFCGFVQDLDATTETHAIYKAVLSTSYVEVFIVEGRLSQRLSLYSYQVHVSFLTQKAISSSSIMAYVADPTVTGFIQVSVTSDAVYDAASGNVLVSFLTTAAWPYQLDLSSPSFVGSVPAHAGLTAQIANVEYYSGQCDTTQDSSCQQKWYVRIITGGICDIGGVYTFQDSLMCRDVNSTEEAGACPDSPAPVQFSIRIKKTDLCDPEALDATEQMTTELSSFFDQVLSTPTDTFQTGDMIYWRFSLKNPQGTIDRIVFNQIEIDLENGGADVLLETANITAVGTSAELSFANTETLVPAGSTANLFFSHKLLRSALPNTVGTLAGNAVDNTVSLSVTVVVDIWYHGNQKRTVHMTGSSAQAASSHSVRVIDNGADNSDFSQKLAGLNLLGSSESAAAAPFSVNMALSLLILSLAYLML